MTSSQFVDVLKNEKNSIQLNTISEKTGAEKRTYQMIAVSVAVDIRLEKRENGKLKNGRAFPKCGKNTKDMKVVVND